MIDLKYSEDPKNIAVHEILTQSLSLYLSEDEIEAVKNERLRPLFLIDGCGSAKNSNIENLYMSKKIGERWKIKK